MSIKLKMNKKLIIIAITTATGGSFYAQTASAALAPNANLSFDPMVIACASDTDPGTSPDNCAYGTRYDSGSYFAFDNNGDGVFNTITEYTSISSNNGINVNTTQAMVEDFAARFIFFANTASLTTVSDTTILSDDGNGNVTMDFSGLNLVRYSDNTNFREDIILSGGTQDCGTSSDGICTNTFPDTYDLSGIQNRGDSTAVITCANTCELNDTFTLDYSTIVAYDHPNGWGGIMSSVHLEGTIGASAVPIPAATWLFGSGLLGLIGVARRKQMPR